MKDEISWNDFEKIDIRVGTIIDAQPFEKAKNPAYKLWIDFGSEIGIRNRYQKNIGTNYRFVWY